MWGLEGQFCSYGPSFRPVRRQSASSASPQAAPAFASLAWASGVPSRATGQPVSPRERAHGMGGDPGCL